MRKGMRYALVLTFLLMSGSLGWAQGASSVRISQIDGTVEILKSGAKNWSSAKEGDALERGDRLAAKAKSAALLLWSNGSMVKVYPDTQVTLAGVTFDLAKKLEQTIFDLDKGRIFAKAQVPEQFFSDFQVRMGSLDLRAQGAEFAVKYNPDDKSLSAWTLIGVTILGDGLNRIRVDEGFQATGGAGGKMAQDNVATMQSNVKQSLTKVSMDLGGSMLAASNLGGPGGKLVTKIGGVTSRRGNAPFKVDFRALIGGGSGSVKSLTWNFGDGDSASTKEASHTFRQQGVYVVTLRVEDKNGETASAQVGISAEEDCGC